MGPLDIAPAYPQFLAHTLTSAQSDLRPGLLGDPGPDPAVRQVPGVSGQQGPGPAPTLPAPTLPSPTLPTSPPLDNL